jgi:hypothetical protein
MISVRLNTRSCSQQQVAKLSRCVTSLYQAQSPILGYPNRVDKVAYQPHRLRHPRGFSTTSATQLRDFFPPKETAFIRQTPPSWPHHGWTEEEMLSVVPEHRKPVTLGDWLAWKLVRMCRYVLRAPWSTHNWSNGRFSYTETGGPQMSRLVSDLRSRWIKRILPLLPRLRSP